MATHAKSITTLPNNITYVDIIATNPICAVFVVNRPNTENAAAQKLFESIITTTYACLQMYFTHFSKHHKQHATHLNINFKIQFFFCAFCDCLSKYANIARNNCTTATKNDPNATEPAWKNNVRFTAFNIGLPFNGLPSSSISLGRKYQVVTAPAITINEIQVNNLSLQNLEHPLFLLLHSLQQ